MLSTVLFLLVFFEVNFLLVLKQVAAILILYREILGLDALYFVGFFLTMAEYSTRKEAVGYNHSLRFFSCWNIVSLFSFCSPPKLLCLPCWGSNINPDTQFRRSGVTAMKETGLFPSYLCTILCFNMNTFFM